MSEKKRQMVFYVVAAGIMILFTALLAACLLTMSGDTLILWSSFLSSTLTLVVIVFACLVLRQTPAEQYRERYGDGTNDRDRPKP